MRRRCGGYRTGWCRLGSVPPARIGNFSGDSSLTDPYEPRRNSRNILPMARKKKVSAVSSAVAIPNHLWVLRTS